MTEELTGKEKLAATANKLREDKETEQDIMSALVPAGMEDMYREASQLGSANLGESVPTLKVHYTNQSEGNELMDGSEPNNGWFFHKHSQEQYESIIVHVLSISAGFRTKKTEKELQKLKPGESTTKYQQLLAGIIIKDDVPTDPFIFYVKGMNCVPMWEFGKEARKYTKGNNAVPLFSMFVKMTNVQTKTDAGNKVWVTHYEIIKENGKPKLIKDPAFFAFVRDNVGNFEEMMSGIASRGIAEEQIQEATVVETKYDVLEELVKAKPGKEHVETSDIPF